MLKINKNNQTHEFNYDGLKIFTNHNTTNFYKTNLLLADIYIDNKLIKPDEIIYLNELSKLNDFIGLNKKSTLMQNIIDYIHDFPIINYDNINNIVNKINDYYDNELLEQTEGDVNKIIATIIELSADKFICAKTITLLLDHFLNSAKLIIFDNCSWLNIEILNQYLNKYNFIILTNDIRKITNNKKYLEILVLANNFTEILDEQVLIDYLELKINKQLSETDIINYLNFDNSYLSYQIDNILNSINK